MLAALKRFVTRKKTEPTPRAFDGDSPAIRARFDAAGSTNEYKNYWSSADSLDANSSASRGVREKLVSRSRYEIGSNAYVDGMVQTHANYTVGVGPSLRMKTASKVFNAMVEMEWKTWSKAVKLRRKLWVMSHAKMSDGESFAILKSNPGVKHAVKLDLSVIETEQCQTPYLNAGIEGYIDGIRFDTYGNPLWYDILPYHPGAQWTHSAFEADQIPAAFVLHWFSMRRGGQHRGIPELRSSMNTGASSRRWREATLAAAESAADISVLLKTQMSPDDGADLAAPFSAIEFQKRMMVALPMGWDAGQMKSEHPNATYEAFHRAQVSEQGRPKNMPYNLAAGDSSGHNFASGKLDFTPYYMQIDVEREDGDDLVLDPLFEMWFEEASLRFGWIKIPGQMPAHEWDWPSHPVADEGAKADAVATRLKTGQATLSMVYSEDGYDLDDHLPKMAEDYGVDEATMRKILLHSIFNDKGAMASMAQVENTANATQAGSTNAP
jgi:capsid protein